MRLQQWGRQQPHCQWVQWSRAESVTEERLEMPGHSSSQFFMYFQNNFSGFYFWVSLKKSFLLVWNFCFSVSGGCAAPSVLWRVKQCMKYHNYPKGGSPWGDLTAQFRSAETLSYFQLVLKIIQQFPYMFYRFWSRFSSCNFLSQEQKSTLIFSYMQEQEDFVSVMQWQTEFRAPGFRKGSPKEVYLVFCSDSKRWDPLPLILSYI